MIQKPKGNRIMESKEVQRSSKENIREGKDQLAPARTETEARPKRYNSLEKTIFAVGVGWMLSSASSVSAAPAYPLKLAPGRHYLVDQSGIPFFMQGDAPWYVIQRLNFEETDYYLSNRWSKGFNAIVLDIASHRYGSGASGQSDVYGNLPFPNTISGGVSDLSRPNPAYFANVDNVIRRAGDYGINVLLFPLYAADNIYDEGWYQEMVANGSNVLYSYGQFIGTRYKDFPNIIWVEAGDYTAPNRSLVDAVAFGILSRDRNHLHTAHAGRTVSALDYYTNTWDQVNTTYTHDITYPKTLSDYNRNPITPTFLIESYYEGHADETTPLTCRQEAYGTVFSGAFGHVFGVQSLWPYASGWQSLLESPGSQTITNVIRLMQTRPWYDCAPDAGHAAVTSGYGTFGDRDYITALRERNGRTVMAYIPNGSMTPTVGMTSISGTTADAWWYNPRDGGATHIGQFATSGSHTFTPSDADDWVLIIDDASQNFGPPGETGKTLKIQASDAGSFRFGFSGNWGQTFALQYTASLNNSWITLSNATVGSSGTFSFGVPATSASGFYRLSRP